MALAPIWWGELTLSDLPLYARGFQLIVCSVPNCTANWDAARLHGFGQLVFERDTQHTVLEFGTFNDHEIGELETPFERIHRNASMDELSIVIFDWSLAAAHRELVALSDDLDFIRAKAGNGEANIVAIVAYALDVELRRRIVDAIGRFQQFEQTVKADRRATIRSEIERVPHIQILH